MLSVERDGEVSRVKQPRLLKQRPHAAQHRLLVRAAAQPHPHRADVPTRRVLPEVLQYNNTAPAG